MNTPTINPFDSSGAVAATEIAREYNPNPPAGIMVVAILLIILGGFGLLALLMQIGGLFLSQTPFFKQFVVGPQPSIWIIIPGILLSGLSSIAMFVGGILLAMRRLQGASLSIISCYLALLTYAVTFVMLILDYDNNVERMRASMKQQNVALPASTVDQLIIFQLALTVGVMIVFGIFYFWVSRYLKRDQVRAHLA